MKTQHSPNQSINQSINIWTKQLSRRFLKEYIHMANRHLKSSTSLIIREMQIKTNELSPHAVWTAVIKKARNNKHWRGCGAKVTLIHFWWKCKLFQQLWKTVWRILKNLRVEVPYGPGIPLLFIYPKNTRTLVQYDICMPMFITTLFLIAKIWKQPKCSSIDEWIKKIWYIFIMEYYSVIKEDEVLPFVKTWMELEVIMLSEISQMEKDKYHMISQMWNKKTLKVKHNKWTNQAKTNIQIQRTNWLPESNG